MCWQQLLLLAVLLLLHAPGSCPVSSGDRTCNVSYTAFMNFSNCRTCMLLPFDPETAAQHVHDVGRASTGYDYANKNNE